MFNQFVTRRRQRLLRTARFLSWLIVAASMLIQLGAQSKTNEDCWLDSFRDRINSTLQSIVVEKQDKSAITNVRGQRYSVVDVGLTGMLDGCVVLAGPIPQLKPDYSWLYDVPDVSLPQEHFLTQDRTRPYSMPISPGDGNTNPRYYARGKFEAKDGAGIRFFYPADHAAWNLKLFLVQHGSGTYTRLGEELVPRSATDPFPLGAGQNLFIENLVDKGYAVAYLRKDAIRPPMGVSKVTTLDGKVITSTFVAHVALPLALAEFAQKFVSDALGQPPRKTYYYGHSGGGITARLINEALGANIALDGSPIINGFIADDAGNGLYLPVSFRDGQDVLFNDAAGRASYVPQIEVARQLYTPWSYLQAKRSNANLIREKGLGDKHRYYEILGVSHFDAGMARRYGADANPKPGPVDLIDLSGFMSALVDVLDAWVEKGVSPPPSKADIPGFEPALAPPEVACPIGTYYAPGGGPTTRFEPFDGASLEPELKDPDRAFLDMNANGVRDTRETVTGGWIRLGLVKSGRAVDENLYATCLSKAAAALTKQRLLPPASDKWYEKQAAKLYRESRAVFK